MSMHLEKPYLSTTSTRKRTEKITKARQIELENDWRDRNKRLKEMNLPKETFEQFMEWVYGRGKKTEKPTQHRRNTLGTASENTLFKEYHKAKKSESQTTARVTCAQVVCSSKPSPTYTGTKMIGISQMAKSNAVPVFSNEEILDISKMRR